jgi:hypothetical protein
MRDGFGKFGLMVVKACARGMLSAPCNQPAFQPLRGGRDKIVGGRPHEP